MKAKYVALYAFGFILLLVPPHFIGFLMLILTFVYQKYSEYEAAQAQGTDAESYSEDEDSEIPESYRERPDYTSEFNREQYADLQDRLR